MIVRERLLDRLPRPDRAVRRHRRRARLPRRAGGAAGQLGYADRAGRRRPAVGAAAPRRAHRGLPRRPGGPRARTTPGVLRLVMGMVGRRPRPGGARATTRTSWSGRCRPERPGQPRPGRDAGPAGRRARGVPHARPTTFCRGLVSPLVLDGGRLVVAHAGLKEAYHGRASGRVRSFALYGDTTGETDEFGLPVRYPWADDYRGRAMVLYGHTPVPEPEWVNNTMCLDTGCVFGGAADRAALPGAGDRLGPGRAAVCYEPAPAPARAGRPAGQPRRRAGAGRAAPGGTRASWTSPTCSASGSSRPAYHGGSRSARRTPPAALEVMSRFAIDPRWLIYLPPTMAPCATSAAAGPAGAPGARRSPPTAARASPRSSARRSTWARGPSRWSAATQRRPRRRFGAGGGSTGAVYTRTGRPFFEPATDRAAARRGCVRRSPRPGCGTSWTPTGCCWTASCCPGRPRPKHLLRHQYAAVGAAARAALPAAAAALERAIERGADVQALIDRVRTRTANADAFTAAYRRYCWPTDGLDGVRLAPFQLLATAQRQLPRA